MGFNAEELPQSESNFEPLPAGWYNAHITGAELKDTKAGNGQYIAIRYDITGPTHEGRVVFGNLNIRNPNPKAEEIGHQQLGELMRAIGIAKVTDTDQLIGGQCAIKLKVRKSEEYGDSNDVQGFKALSGGVKAPSAAPATSGAAASGKPPWAQ
ncbi:putative single stranded DNA annealing protein [Idiomarinaceae phage 1N2-2]|uniref:putative single stranded DNA annealing protein n=1 Tax=Idiomarinaceae phage 1N2-2 TaxID=1536592 RepID=UPI0004F92BF9|nr:putative single stranded DNA annealing protein [Idiomarinaceae phage 1N2-2]AIM40753.1 putative single stranded DNA annealing protein [Idiomarinaceae phage 1N2-2]